MIVFQNIKFSKIKKNFILFLFCHFFKNNNYNEKILFQLSFFIVQKTKNIIVKKYKYI